MWSTGINRNIVECKADNGATWSALTVSVLIETLWNVKEEADRAHSVCFAVLIETLWNVK